ncbi:hypothetical protein L596_023790 [Steinernema carpocapsae]|uniref:Uncharacterized protein n=1 Tax=Steinernema carpocapsae TaxID=34508 RepID=A0A4V5ZZJ7_STECR|nr:hypothetical protein L596_023790 [Steinernema carpocapsae]
MHFSVFPVVLHPSWSLSSEFRFFSRAFSVYFLLQRPFLTGTLILVVHLLLSPSSPEILSRRVRRRVLRLRH